MALAQHQALALGAAFCPFRVIAQRAGCTALACHLNKQGQGRLGVRHDAVIGHEHTADLGGFDVHMHKAAALCVDVYRAGVPVGPAVANAQHKITGQHAGIAIPVAGLQATHARHQGVVIGNAAPAHQCRNDRDARELGQFHQQVAGIGVDDAATRHDQRFVSAHQHVQRLVDLGQAGHWFVDRQRRVGVDVKFDLGQLHIDRQVDQNGAGAARAHQVKCLLECPGHLGRFAHGHRPFGHGLGNAFDVHRLKVFLVQTRPGRLPGDAQNRNAVGHGRIQTRDHVGSGRARCANAHADLARLGPGVTLGHVRCTLNMPGQHMGNLAALAQCGIHRVDGRPRHTKGLRNAFFFHHAKCGFNSGHAGHRVSLCKVESNWTRCYGALWGLGIALGVLSFDTPRIGLNGDRDGPLQGN